MLPEPQDEPALLLERAGCVHVARPVPRHLGAPVLAVRGREPVMLLTAVPETTVDEDSDSSLGEGHVRRPAQ